MNTTTTIADCTDVAPRSTVRGLVPIQIEGYAGVCPVGYHYDVKSDNPDGTVTIFRNECAGVPHYATVPVIQVEPVYKLVNGLNYDNRAHPDAIKALEEARKYNYRVRISRGYTEFELPRDNSNKVIGEDWLEENDVEGRIGNSVGPIKVPLLINNRRSTGGGAITGDSIVRVKVTGKGGRVLWQHPQYHKPELTVRLLKAIEANKPEMKRHSLTHEVLADGQQKARFNSQHACKRFIDRFE